VEKARELISCQMGISRVAAKKFNQRGGGEEETGKKPRRSDGKEEKNNQCSTRHNREKLRGKSHFPGEDVGREGPQNLQRTRTKNKKNKGEEEKKRRRKTREGFNLTQRQGRSTNPKAGENFGKTNEGERLLGRGNLENFHYQNGVLRRERKKIT